MAIQTNFIDRQVGRRVSVLREMAGVSSREAASLIGCSLDEYNLLEVGALRFKAHQLINLSQNFGVPGSAFFEEVEFNEPQSCGRFDVVQVVPGVH